MGSAEVEDAAETVVVLGSALGSVDVVLTLGGTLLVTEGEEKAVVLVGDLVLAVSGMVLPEAFGLVVVVAALAPAAEEVGVVRDAEESGW